MDPLTPTAKAKDYTYLQLLLQPQTTAILPMSHVQEVLVSTPERITSMPNMPPCILGLLNQRSRILWVVNLPQMLGLESVTPDIANYNIVIIRVGNIPLGLVVYAVKGVVRLISNSLQSPVGTVAPELIPYIKGCILQLKEVLLVLDAEAIAHSPALRGRVQGERE